jgi:hypothetical protein
LYSDIAADNASRVSAVLQELITIKGDNGGMPVDSRSLYESLMTPFGLKWSESVNIVDSRFVDATKNVLYAKANPVAHNAADTADAIAKELQSVVALAKSVKAGATISFAESLQQSATAQALLDAFKHSSKR